MMNVLFITPDFYPNSTGFANASFNLINAILVNGNDKYKIFVYTYAQLDKKRELQISAKIYRYKKYRHNRLTRIFYEKREYKKLKEIIDINSIDIIFFETNTFLYQQFWTLRDYGRKVFVRIHSTADTEVPVFSSKNTIGSKMAYRLIKKFMCGVSNILATSNYYIDFVKRYYLEDNVYTIWDNKSYGLLYNTSIDSTSPNFNSGNENIFMTMGKLSNNGLTQKGIPDLLKAVYYMKDLGELKPDFKLIVVGDGDKFSFIQNLVKELELESYVELIKKATHDETLQMISSAKAIVLLSRYEGQSMFITESLSLGKALILSDNNGMQDMIQNGVNGYCVRTGDSIAAADALIRIQNLDDVTLSTYGNNSRMLYKQKYSGEAVYRQFDNVIKMRVK